MRPFLGIAAALLILGPLVAQANSLDKSMVIRVIQQQQAEYQRCYTEALGWNPALKGRLVIHFTVDPDGQVTSAAEPPRASEKFPDEVMARCVADQFRLLRFPAGTAEFQVVYPMIFVQKPGPARQP